MYILLLIFLDSNFQFLSSHTHHFCMVKPRQYHSEDFYTPTDQKLDMPFIKVKILMLN